MSTRILHCLALVVCSLAINYSIAYSQTCPNPSFSFGLIADCQCGSSSCQSQDHLQDCVDYFNQENIEFLGHLGDIIQTNFSNFNVVLPIINQSIAPVNFALGNHDYDIPNSEKPNLPTILQMPDFYYDEVLENWRFIYLETTETGSYAQAAHPNVAVCGVAGLSSTQLNWVSQRIQLAEQNDENVILFGHHPHEFLCNGNALRSILEASPNVVAYMTGHNHPGNYELLNNVHYLTLTSMLNRSESTYSEVTISNDSIIVAGFGSQPDFVLTYNIVASFDQDNDGICDENDLCPNFDNNLIGLPCDDNDPCTSGETYDSNCSCSGGTLVDADNDGVCDLNDQCPGFDDGLIGTSCNDMLVCTSNDVYTTNCICEGTDLGDSDGDGICDGEDQCANFDDNLIGQICEDGDPCTTGETYDVNCECSGGSFMDSDNDGICDAEDQCPNFDNNLIGTPCDDNLPCTSNDVYTSNCICQGSDLGDSDGDGICDGEDQCANFDDNLIGQICEDGDPCTTGETYDANCECSGGSLADSDNDGVCDVNDQCPNFDNNLIGTPCDDNIICFEGSTWDINCLCNGGMFADADNDGICNALDSCPGADDRIDTNNNGIPDGCEDCVDYITETTNRIITEDQSAYVGITTNGRVLFGNINYRAGQEVNLTSGFEVRSGAVFHGFIAPCN